MGALDSQFRFPLDFDDLGRTDDEKSFIAVVHADGNGLGRLVSSIGQNYARIKDNSRYIDALRGFSERVKRASEEALKGTLRTLQDAIGKDGALLYHFSGQAPLTVKRIGSQFNLPFRPLIFGGDDVTFVCDGRIGIAIALEFIRQFQAATAVQFGAPLTACAGIAIVKSHYPFARAYEDGSGWDQGYCGYYDALELMDLYVPCSHGKREIPDAQS
ncbi:MAG: hypothetical protein IPK19_25095 [Chloroflexi bacterium]|nr:hypothetical protein [Chloroflexota bacterium]